MHVQRSRVNEFNSCPLCTCFQRAHELGATDAEAGTRAEVGPHLVLTFGIEIPNSSQGPSPRMDPNRRQVSYGGRHEPFTAGLVSVAFATFKNGDRVSPCRSEGGCEQPHRTSAHDHDSHRLYLIT
jgi:hypothetical protein